LVAETMYTLSEPLEDSFNFSYAKVLFGKLEMDPVDVFDQITVDYQRPLMGIIP